jgi:hypothetical protein
MTNHQEYLTKDSELQNAIWFQQKIDIFDADEIYLETDMPIAFDAETVTFENGRYIRGVCYFKSNVTK